MSSHILKFDVYNKTKNEFLNEIDNYKKVNIVSGNPEVLLQGLKNKKLFDNFNSEETVIIPDGIGTIIASRIINDPIKEKIAGIEVMEDLIKKYEKEDKSIYLVGTDQETLEKCVQNLKKKYPNLNIVGYHNGFFDLNNCDDILNDIKISSPYAIFVAMGCPRQEEFIIDNIDKLPCKVYMGVGGSFDCIAGKSKRAPKWMINCGLEWLYRTIKEPVRIKRLGSVFKFIFKVKFYK